MKKLKELFLNLPQWGQTIVGLFLFVTLIFLWMIIWEFIGPSTTKWFLIPLGYIITLAIYGGATLFSGYHLVRVTMGVLRGIPKRFGETKMKEVPGLIGYFFVYIFWILFTIFFLLAGTVQWILEPFGMSLQSLGILPYIYPGYFLDNPVYIFGYKVIPIFD